MSCKSGSILSGGFPTPPICLSSAVCTSVGSQVMRITRHFCTAHLRHLVLSQSFLFSLHLGKLANRATIAYRATYETFTFHSNVRSLQFDGVKLHWSQIHSNLPNKTVNFCVYSNLVLSTQDKSFLFLFNFCNFFAYD